MRRFAAIMAAAGSILLVPQAFAADVTMEPAEAGSVTVDATVYHLATPDVVNLNVNCEAPTPGSRTDVRNAFKTMLQTIAQTVGNDGQVRRNGTPSLYQYYDPTGYPMPIDSMQPSEVKYTGNLNVTVLNVRSGAGQRIGDAMEEMGCSITWDARVMSSGGARAQYPELSNQLAAKKAFFEQLLGVTLRKVSSMYVSTSADSSGYYGGAAGYDPESNTIPAMTMLSVTYDIGTGTASR